MAEEGETVECPWCKTTAFVKLAGTVPRDWYGTYRADAKQGERIVRLCSKPCLRAWVQKYDQTPK